MVAAVVLGIIAGVVSFLPLVLGLRATKHVTRTSNFGHMGILLLSLLVSIIILFGALIACILIARDLVFPFSLAEVLALVVAAIAFGVSRVLRK